MKWEYSTVEFSVDRFGAAKSLVSQLDEHGDDGWELVSLQETGTIEQYGSVTGWNYLAAFKRPLITKPKIAVIAEKYHRGEITFSQARVAFGLPEQPTGEPYDNMMDGNLLATLCNYPRSTDGA